MKRPLSEYRKFGPFIYYQTDELEYKQIRSDLEDWGCTDISSKEMFESVNVVDFNPPNTSNQPIRSSIEFDNDKVIEASMRYGILDMSYPRHPTVNPKQLNKLKQIVEQNDPPDTTIVVNYGDRRRTPRPHVLLGFIPSVAEDEEIVKDSGKQRLSWNTVFEFIRGVGQDIQKEFTIKTE